MFTLIENGEVYAPEPPGRTSRRAARPPHPLSDASVTSPGQLWEQLRARVNQHGFPLADVLRLATGNTAAVLQLKEKGCLSSRADGRRVEDGARQPGGGARAFARRHAGA